MTEECIGLGGAWAAWDFTPGDARRSRDRLEPVIDAAEQFRKREIATDFVVLLHAQMTQLIERNVIVNSVALQNRRCACMPIFRGGPGLAP